MGILDFREIRSPNPNYVETKRNSIGQSDFPDDFELFAKEFFQLVRKWRVFKHVSNGPDGGIDLGVEEATERGLIRWLVSCKHKAHSNIPVKDSDENRNLLALLSEWECDGFIPFYTTVPSAKLDVIIRGIEKSGKLVKRYIKDDIERDLLRNPDGISLAARYFPKSLVNHYGMFVKTIEAYSINDVVVENDLIKLGELKTAVAGCSDEAITNFKKQMVEYENISATFRMHKPYFLIALRQAISLAPNFFHLSIPVEEVTQISDATPTWDSFALLDVPFGFAQFIIAAWSFWDGKKANTAFGELSAFRSQSIEGEFLTQDEMNKIRELEEFKESVFLAISRGSLLPGPLGIKLKDSHRDIIVRLFAFAN